MLKRSLLTFHSRQTLLKLMWFGILRDKLSSSRLPLGKTSAGPARSARFHYKLKHKVPNTPWYAVRSELHNRGSVFSFGDEFYSFLLFCPLSCCKAWYLLSISVPNWGRAEGKASSTKICDKSFSEHVSSSLKTTGFWFAGGHNCLTPSWMFLMGNLFFYRKCMKNHSATHVAVP